MNIFDRLVDEFSIKDLRQRVWSVVVIGIAICALTLVVGYFFFRSTITIAASGTGIWSSSESNIIDIQLDNIGDVERVQNDLESPMTIEIETPGGGTTKTPVKMLSVDPQTHVVQVEAPEIEPETKTKNRFNVSVILVQKPYWQLLWEKK